MLEFLQVSNPNQIERVLRDYNPLKDTWIVSDLKSKQEIQAESIKKYGYYTDDAILRVSDFWRIWLRRLEPTRRVVGSDFIRSLVQCFVDEHGETLGLIDSESSTLNRVLQEFAPVLLHSTSDGVIREWLESEKSSGAPTKKWERWYLLARQCINQIVNVRGVIDTKWIPAHLQNLEIEKVSWGRTLYVDLGSELTSVELGLFKTLSNFQDVKIIVPTPTWSDKFPFLLAVYRDHFGYGKVSHFSGESALTEKAAKRSFVRLSTQLSEVKFAVSQIRSWLDAGISIDKIAIIAADIEDYWPVLHQYLDEEGIPFQKDIVAKVNSLGDIQNFISELKNYSSDVSWDSLERRFYNRAAAPELQFEKFKSMFYQLFDEDDLGREAKIKELFYKQVDHFRDIDREEFLSSLIKVWIALPESSDRQDIFELVFKDILSQSIDVKMKRSRWLSFVRTRLSRKEKTLKRAARDGVGVMSLMSAHMIQADHRIYLGLNDEFYTRREVSMINRRDADALKLQFDLALDVSEESYLDFNLRWQADAKFTEAIFTSAHLSFNSDPLNAGLFFIENSPESDLSGPGTTRLDERGMAAAYDPEYRRTIKASASRAQDDIEGYLAHIPSEKFRNLSVSHLENYGRCSFKLLAAKGFGLRDFSEISIDLDPRDRGTLIHALFEFLIKQLSNGPVSAEKVTEFLNTRREKTGLYKNMDHIWDVQRIRFEDIARKFIALESERLKIFSARTEIDAEIYFNLQSGRFEMTKPEDGFTFKIRIDRVDRHRASGYEIVYDYKGSGTNLESYSNWVSDFQLQMLLYVTALRLESTGQSNIKGALYYFYNNFEFGKGIVDRSIGRSDFNLGARNGMLADEEEILDLEGEFLETVRSLLSNLKSGKFETTPYDNRICKDCEWRKLCRATHLL